MARSRYAEFYRADSQPALFMKDSPPESDCHRCLRDTAKFLVIPGVEWYLASCNGRLVLVVNRKQSALTLNESKRPAPIIRSATISITVFAFVNNAG